ncbi:RING-H2 finger protein ATL67-like [Cornus florida]|uniref:RING-H2 finger protein ATL67-like n=1 Tax=Cornus florida TaxID=4283 RepID=UPI0028A21AAD|nr:RING-H2 finger protein ATL67-like [Cornus florida]
MANHGISFLFQFRHLLVPLGVIAFAAFIYYYAIACCCCLRGRGGPQHRPIIVSELGEIQIAVENPVAEPIPAHKHQKGTGLVGEDSTCAICLCDFEEGEELRTLPVCMHSYHVACIDMWLYSHSSCPTCRSPAMPSSCILRNESKYGHASNR